MSKIESIKIKNFKGISQIDTNIHSSNVYVVGGNGKGKTSFIDAVWTTLTGKNIPTEPITQGERESVIEIELEKFVAFLDFKRGKGKEIKQSFRLISKDDGSVIPQPRTFLNNMLGIVDFDPNHFFSLSAKKQVEYFCQITNLNVSDIDKKFSELYEERTFRNKNLKLLRDQTNVWFDAEIAKKDVIDIKTLYEKKVAESEKIAAFNRITTGVDERAKKIVEMRNRIAEIETEIAKVSGEIEKATVWLNEPANQPMSTTEFGLIDKEIAETEQSNAKILEHKSAKELTEKITAAENDISDIENEMAALTEQKKQKLISGIDIPGLTFDGEMFLFEGLPFEQTQINTANQLIAGLRIGQKLLNEVKILKFDGSLIDDNNMSKIKDWANENDIQLFVEIVDRAGGKLEIKIDQD